MNAYLDGWRRGFDFDGRSTRTQYFVFKIINAVIFVALYALFVITDIYLEAGNDAGFLAMLPVLMFALVLVGPWLGVTVRRLHDSDKPGILIFASVVPIVGGVISLILMLLPGSPGTNRYGTNPRLMHREAPTAF